MVVGNKLRTEENDLDTLRAVYKKPIANITLNSERLKALSSKVRNKVKMPTLTTTQHSAGSLGQSN